jgi:hypothetical protein
MASAIGDVMFLLVAVPVAVLAVDWWNVRLGRLVRRLGFRDRG